MSREGEAELQDFLDAYPRSSRAPDEGAIRRLADRLYRHGWRANERDRDAALEELERAEARYGRVQ